MYSNVILSGALNDSTHHAPWIMQKFPTWQKLKGQGQGEDFEYGTFFYFFVLKAKGFASL